MATLRHQLGAALFYAGEYTRAAAVLDCAYHAGYAYAETGNAGKALPQLRFYVENAGASADEDEARKILETRFVIAQLLAADGRPDEAFAELRAIRPLLADTFGDDSIQVRNLDKQAARLSAPPPQPGTLRARHPAADRREKRSHGVDPATQFGGGGSEVVRVVVAGVAERRPDVADLAGKIGLEIAVQADELCPHGAVGHADDRRARLPEFVKCLLKCLPGEQGDRSGPPADGIGGWAFEQVERGTEETGRSHCSFWRMSLVSERASSTSGRRDPGCPLWVPLFSAFKVSAAAGCHLFKRGSTSCSWTRHRTWPALPSW